MLNRFSLYVIVFSCVLISSIYAQQNSEQPEFFPGTVIVKFTPTAVQNNVLTRDQNFLNEIQSLGVISEERFFPDKYRKTPLNIVALTERDKKIQKLENELSRIYVLKYTSPESPLSVITRLKTLIEVEYAEPQYIMYPTGDKNVKFVPNDSLYSQQQFLKVMKAEEAWDIEKGDSTLVVAISDTGIDWDHPDLNPNIFINTGETGVDSQGRDKRTNGIDDDNNGKVDDWHGWDYVAGPNGTSQDNDTRGGAGHGTSVAGLINAATNNRIGIASIGNRIKLLPLKIGRDDGSGGLSISSDVFMYALNMGARAFNASWGGFGYSQSFSDLIDLVTAQGMLVCGGAGNHGGIAPFYPAAYKSVLDVGVCNSSDVISGASGYGPPVDVFTPADGALSVSQGGGYSPWGGVTSAAAPIATGLAGLVTSHFPQYSADQIRERIRVTCDNIDAKNPTKAKMAGKGRVNALRALTDPPTPSIRIDTVAFVDPNNNGAFEVGEEIGVVVRLKNYLAATGQPITLTLVLSSTTGDVSVVQPTATVNALGPDEIGDNASNKLSFKVVALSNYDESFLFRVDIKSGAYEDFDYFNVIVNQSYRTIKSNNLSLTLPADGSLGFRDYPDNKQGSGLMNVSSNLKLAMGGLIVGADASHVVDAVRSSTDYFLRDNDFRMLQSTVLTTPGVRAATEGSASFDDAYASVSRKLNVNVKMESFAFSNKNLNDIIFTKYTVRNDSSGTISNLRIGLFMDLGQIINNKYPPGNVYYDSIRYSGYCVRSDDTPLPIVGSFVIDSLSRNDPTRSTFWAIDNDPTATGNPFGTYDGFTYQEKWTAMSSFVGRYRSSGGGSYMPGNVGYVISSRAFTLAPGASATAVFGHYMATSYNTVATKIDDAIKYWRGQITVGVKNESLIPTQFYLGQNYPNPFSSSTTIRLDLTPTLSYQERVITSDDRVRCTLKVYDIFGRQVLDLSDRTTNNSTVIIHDSDLPGAGVYFYQMIVGNEIQTKMMTLLK